MPLNIYILLKMKNLMDKHDLTMYQVAKRCQYPRSTVCGYMNGKTQVPQHFVESFCQMMDMPVAELYTGYEQCCSLSRELEAAKRD